VTPGRVTKLSRVFLVALEQLDRDALRAAQEADAHAGADGDRLLVNSTPLALISAATVSMSFTVRPKWSSP
jgi:hypothetical protein